jgi:DNA-binding NtrC family response regulator/tetratricopeptide (TPR) repeat protein
MLLTEALGFARAGRFVDALRTLDGGAATTAEKQGADILRVSLLERLGHYSRSRFLAEKALRSKGLPPAYQSDCRFVQGLIDWDEGRFDRALEQFQRARDLARMAGDAERACWIQLRLMVVQCGRVSPAAAASWISQTRQEVTRLGLPTASAALHVFVGEIAVRHGVLETGRRLTRLGLNLLQATPNAWLEALAENCLVAIAIIESDVESGLRHALAASAAAELSGAMTVRRACLGNLGILHVMQGAFDQARDCYRRAATELHAEGEYNNAVLESQARLDLLEGRLDAAREGLDTIDSGLHTNADRTLYSHRHSQLTRALVLNAEGRYREALDQTAAALELADRSGDRLLRDLCQLARAEILAADGQSAEFIRQLDSLGAILPTLPVELLGHYDRIIACALSSAGNRSDRAYGGRASRLFDGLGHRAGAIQLERTWMAAARRLSANDAPALPCVDPRPESAATVVQDVSALLMHAGRPDLLARDLVAVLADADCVLRAAATARHEDGGLESLAAYAAATSDSDTGLAERTYSLGQARRRSIEVSCIPRDDVTSVATLNAVCAILEVVRDLETARTEREERLDLWPIEELPEEGDGAVIAGAMRDVMRTARKVAPNNVSVLITGESGTGKEIVARAIHQFSNRNGRPFVPFNCTAVPRDLLESQLFGYRRGAFTGAERDHPGLIRAAKDGTLFLDEVGELGLELQPKLLRFLESGEITPLGEAEVITVNARVVAATNANLEHLVREGRFRADLYYRLKVFPLEVPPLRERRDEIPHFVRQFVARAAAEFGKGHLRVDNELMELLSLFAWPGNIRQLNNELRRIVAMAEADDTLTPDALSPDIRGASRAMPRVATDTQGMALEESLPAALARIERQLVGAALQKHHGRVDVTAKALGISRKGLYLKRQRFGL